MSLCGRSLLYPVLVQHSLPPPLQPLRSPPTLCHLRTPRDSRYGLNSAGRSPGIRHEVTSRPLSGLPALPSAGLLSACQTGSGVGCRSLWWDVASLATASPDNSVTAKAQDSHPHPPSELRRRKLSPCLYYMVFDQQRLWDPKYPWDLYLQT